MNLIFHIFFQQYNRDLSNLLCRYMITIDIAILDFLLDNL